MTTEGTSSSKHQPRWLQEYMDSPEKQKQLYKKTLIIVVLAQIFGGAGLAAGITGNDGLPVPEEVTAFLDFGQMVKVADTDGHLNHVNGHVAPYAGYYGLKPTPDSMSGRGLQGG